MLHSPHISCCASLRQTLLQGWQQSFPLHSSPFRQMAAHSGATPRELLSLCQALQRSGALQTIQPNWGEALQRECWRLAFEAPTGDAGGMLMAAALAKLPGCARIERTERIGLGGMPLLWAEVEVVDAQALDTQLRHLPAQPVARLQLKGSAPDALPCDDPALAAQLEAGLPLCSRPFVPCAKQLGCSEYKLLAKLQAWRRSGLLAGLALKPPPTRVPVPGVLALWKGLAPTPGSLGLLQAHSGVDRVFSAPTSPAWPWRLSLVLRAAPQLALDQLREITAHAGLVTPDSCARVLIEQPRNQALLFLADRRA